MDNENLKMCLSIFALNEKLGDNLTYTRIEYSCDEDGEYYDLYNEHDELCCVDGEDVLLLNDKDGVITFINQNGLKGIEFRLTLKECLVASFFSEI